MLPISPSGLCADFSSTTPDLKRWMSVALLAREFMLHVKSDCIHMLKISRSDLSANSGSTIP